MSESKKIRDWRENCQKVVQYGEWTSKVQRYKEVVAMMQYCRENPTICGTDYDSIVTYLTSIEPTITDKDEEGAFLYDPYWKSAWNTSKKAYLLDFRKGITASEFEFIENCCISKRLKEVYAEGLEIRRNYYTSGNWVAPKVWKYWLDNGGFELEKLGLVKVGFYRYQDGMNKFGYKTRVDFVVYDGDDEMFLCDYYAKLFTDRCPLCDQSFERKPRQKTPLCPECYKKYRNFVKNTTVKQNLYKMERRDER